MESRAFPLKERVSNTIDGIVGTRGSDGPFLRVSSRTETTHSVRSVVFSRGKRISVASFRDDRYLYPAQAIDILGERPLHLSSMKVVDSLRKKGFVPSSDASRPRVAIVAPSKEAFAAVEESFRSFSADISAGFSGFRFGISSGRLAYAPLIGAMALGMVSALSLERSFGQGVGAEEARIVYVERTGSESVLGAEDGKGGLLDTEELLTELAAEDPDTKEFENRVRKLVKGYPIEDMIPYIIEKDRTVAMFLVAIAKKESDWGRRVPVLEGQDCFNYWGYRGIRKMMGTGGHTCFNSRQDAVNTVGKRLETLIIKNKLDTPADLILWKCGSSCAGHSSYSVQKWIADVDLYYRKLNDEGKE